MARFKFKFVCMLDKFVPIKTVDSVPNTHNHTHTKPPSPHTHWQKAQGRWSKEKKKQKTKNWAWTMMSAPKYTILKVWQTSCFSKCTKICKMPLTLYSFRLSKLQNGHIYCLLIFSVSTSPLERNFNSYLNQISLFLFL